MGYPLVNIENGPFIGGFTHWKMVIYCDLMGFYSDSMGYSWDIPDIPSGKHTKKLLKMAIDRVDLPSCKW